MSKLFLNKDFLKIDDLSKFTEIFLLVPFLSEIIYYQNILPVIGKHNESLYTKLFYTGRNYIKETNQIENSTISVLPFKYNFNDERVKQICELASNYKKMVVGFFNDDSSEIFNLPENFFLFRTSINKTVKHKNERGFPCLIPDHFCENYNYNNSISFCGAITSQSRSNIINDIKNLNLKTDFIIRNEFWGCSVNLKARLEYNTNMLNSKYTLCVRGAGNFSYRFYEALSFGRIPILVDTDCVLPFTQLVDWNKYAIIIKENEINTLPDLIKNDKRCPKTIRKFWKEYLSVEGYTKNFLQELNL